MRLGLGLGLGLSLGGGNSLPRYVTDYFNGFELSGSTYSGGPTVVADNTGVLVTSPADVLPIEGMRLATTVADGAVLGSELAAPTENGEDAENYIESLGNNRYRFVGDGNTATYLRWAVTAYKTYRITVSDVVVTAGSIKCSNEGNGDVFTALTSEGSFDVTSIDNALDVFRNIAGEAIDTTATFSVREVIPTWLPTTSLGAPIHASTPLRTRKGTVSVYGEDFRGPLIEPPRTNLFLNSTVPVTQNITTTAQQYTVTVLGTGSLTLSGTATGVSTEGNPLTVTASAGTLTCTMAGTLSRVNVEAGAFGTSFIDTGDTTVTRPAANLTRPTAGTALESGNNFAVYGRVVPKAGGQTADCFTSYVNGTNITIIGSYNASTFRLTKYIGGVLYQSNTPFSLQSDTPFEYLAYCHTIHGMGLAVRSWNGSVWSAWSVWGTNADTQNAPIASTYQIGARNNASHFAANYPFTKIIALNPALNPQTQIADLLAKGRI